MEKKLYELPIIEVIDIDKNDTITTSGTLGLADILNMGDGDDVERPIGGLK